MGRAEELAALEALVPWTQERFRSDLAGLREKTAEDARALAREARLLAGIAAQVPRCRGDERGASPWISFTREVAVAASISDRAATGRIRHARRLTSVLPVTLSQLDAGLLPAHRAQAFVRELEGFDDVLAGQLDALLGERIRVWSAGRIGNEIRAAAARLDAEAVAARAASKNTSRSVQLIPDADDQATVVICGPAVPLVRWHSDLDRRARALRAAGDPRTLDQLRFDLAAGSFPCAVHAPADPAATTGPQVSDGPVDDAAVSAFGLRSSFTEPAPLDCRRSRPIQANLTVPVETSLGLSNEPGWLDGYGWLSAPTCRLLLVDAELRRLCVQTGTGQLVHVDDQLVRPEPTPTGVRRSVLDMVLDDIILGRDPTGVDPGGPPDIRQPGERNRSTIRASAWPGSSACGTGSATARPRTGCPPHGPTSTTRTPGPRARPPPGTSPPGAAAATCSSTTAGPRCAPPPAPSGSAPPGRPSKSIACSPHHPASMKTRTAGSARSPCPTPRGCTPSTSSSSLHATTTTCRPGSRTTNDPNPATGSGSTSSSTTPPTRRCHSWSATTTENRQ
jgi:hypothetical protein